MCILSVNQWRWAYQWLFSAHDKLSPGKIETCYQQAFQVASWSHIRMPRVFQLLLPVCFCCSARWCRLSFSTLCWISVRGANLYVLLSTCSIYWKSLELLHHSCRETHVDTIYIYVKGANVKDNVIWKVCTEFIIGKKITSLIV